MDNVDFKVIKSFDKAIDFLKVNGFDVTKPPRPAVKIEHAEELLNGVGERILKICGQKWHTIDPQKEIVSWMENNANLGLALMGGCGNGKTLFAMRILPTIIYMTSERVAGCYHVRQLKDKWNEAIKKDILVIDDVGTEEMVNEYGIKRYLFMDLVEICEEKNKLLIVTTNLNGKELLEKYDERTYSRLKGMTQTIVFKGKDNRINGRG